MKCVATVNYAIMFAAGAMCASGFADIPITEATPERARTSMQSALAWLLDHQEPDGAWGSHRDAAIGIDEFWSNPETHRSWRVAVTALGCLAVLDQPRSEKTTAAFDRGIDYILDHALVKRISEWDVDNVWAYVYGISALARAYSITPLDQQSRKDRIREVAQGVIKKLAVTQSSSGGWGYYDFDAYTHPGSWATSFTTAVGIIGLLDAREAGFEVDARVLETAVRAVKRCRLVTGAYSYSINAISSPARMEGIDQIKGSLSRIQVCNLALLRAGENISIEQLKKGLDHFFEDHKFLDVARGKPIPHEAYYYNSGYFYFFGHYYASQIIQRLPAEDRARYQPLLQREIIKTQEADGSMWDYPMNSYHRPYGTAFSVMTLNYTLSPVDIPERKDPINLKNQEP